MKLLLLIILSSNASLHLVHAGENEYPKPKLECSVGNSLHARSEGTAPGVCDVSSGKLIFVSIKLDTIDFNNLVRPSINPTDPSVSRDFFSVKVFSDNDGKEIPVEITDNGGGQELQYTSVGLYLQIPVSHEIRMEKVRKYWNNLKEGRPSVSAWGKDADMAKIMERDLVYNQPGHFRIVCKYVSHKVGTWNGELSDTLKINVIDKGTSLDLLSGVK
jgi:hypothetical protein